MSLTSATLFALLKCTLNSQALEVAWAPDGFTYVTSGCANFLEQ